MTSPTGRRADTPSWADRGRLLFGPPGLTTRFCFGSVVVRWRCEIMVQRNEPAQALRPNRQTPCEACRKHADDTRRSKRESRPPRPVPAVTGTVIGQEGYRGRADKRNGIGNDQQDGGENPADPEGELHACDARPNL